MYNFLQSSDRISETIVKITNVVEIATSIYKRLVDKADQNIIITQRHVLLPYIVIAISALFNINDVTVFV